MVISWESRRCGTPDTRGAAPVGHRGRDPPGAGDLRPDDQLRRLPDSRDHPGAAADHPAIVAFNLFLVTPVMIVFLAVLNEAAILFIAYDHVRGNLLSLQTPSGYSLTFLCDSSGRYQKISDSRGRSVEYRYDPLGRLVRFADSSGNQESYTYDGANHLLLVLDGDGRQILKNEYDGDDVVRQTLSDGRQLKYRYDRHPADALSKCVFTDANGFITTFNFNKQQFSQSLPEASAN